MAHDCHHLHANELLYSNYHYGILKKKVTLAVGGTLNIRPEFFLLVDLQTLLM